MQSTEYHKFGSLHTNGIFEMCEIPINGTSKAYAMRKETLDITHRKKLHGEALYSLL